MNNSAPLNVRIVKFATAELAASAVEFAMVLPLLVVLAFGAFSVGNLMWVYHIASNSARDASRYGARLAASCTSAGVASFADPGAEARIQNLARTGSIDGTSSPLLPGWTSGVQVTLNCVNNTSGFSGRYDSFTHIPTVSVRVTAPVTATFFRLFPGVSLGTVSVSNTETYTE